MATTTGRSLILSALRHETVARPPWVPFAGVHAGKLKGYSATEVLIDEEKLFESLLAVNELYDPDGQPVLFDLQIEAEILGCELMWAEKAPPSVVSHPMAADPTPPDRLLEADDGRLPLVLNVMRRMKTAVGEHTALYGLLCGPFTLAAHLRGTEIFMDMILNPSAVHDLVAYTTAVNKRMADLYIDAGMDVIAVVDPMVSQIGPGHFTEFLSGSFGEVFAHIGSAGAFSSFFVCGDATKNLDVMCHTFPDSISIDENIDIVAAKTITDAHNICLGGNIPLTTVMLMGSQQDNMKFVIDLLSNLDGTRNFILAPGCDMPYDTPTENTVGIGEAVRDPGKTGALVANYESADIFDIDIDLPAYDRLKRPLVEVFTLDSDSCAACMYMLDAAQRGANELAGQVDLVEYKMTSPENVARCKQMGVANLPSIYVNGELKYSSIIPSADELRTVLHEVLAATPEQ